MEPGTACVMDILSTDCAVNVSLRVMMIKPLGQGLFGKEQPLQTSCSEMRHQTMPKFLYSGHKHLRRVLKKIKIISKLFKTQKFWTRQYLLTKTPPSKEGLTNKVAVGRSNVSFVNIKINLWATRLNCDVKYMCEI